MPKKQKKHRSEKKRRPRKGARSFWSGTISFGLVSVPVNLFPASRSSGVSFRLVDQDGAPLVRRYYCPREEVDVHPEHIVRGFPLDANEYVIVRDEELEAVEPKKSREIDLRRFVNLADVSPMFFLRAYYLTPGGDSNKAYRLLAQVMQESGLAGIATFVMRDREYLIAIVAENGILRGAALRFEDELRRPSDVGLPSLKKPGAASVSRMKQLLKKLTVKKLDARWMQDEYAERVHRLVEKKRKGRQGLVKVEPDSEQEETSRAPSVDLLETIRRSLQAGDGAGNGRQRKADDLKNKSKEQLYERAQRLNIPGRSKLNKQELIREIQRARATG